MGAAYAFVQKHAQVSAKISGLKRADVSNLPLRAIRELLVNAVVHADYAQQGAPIRATISDLGPLLLGRLLQLNETQAGVLSLAFRVADEEGLLLLDLPDLRALLGFISDNAARLRKTSHRDMVFP